MMTPLVRLLIEAALIGYFLGSIPTGYIVGRYYKIDIRKQGSGNIGATNVARVIGKGPGLFVFLCDFLKGFFAVRFALFVAIIDTNVLSKTDNYIVLSAIIAGIACILGHNYTCWLGFRGGKGVATTAGVLVGLIPEALLIGFLIWIIVFLLCNYVSLASICAACSLPFTSFFLNGIHSPLFYFAIIAALLGIVRHRSNIQRLIRGTEPKFERKQLR